MKEVKVKSLIVPKWLLIVVAIFLSVVIISSGAMLLYKLGYQNKVYDGVKIGDLELSGKTRGQAKALIQAKTDKLADQGVVFYFEDNQLVVEPIVSSGSEIGIAYELWLYDSEQIIDKLYTLGRSKSLLTDWGALVRLFLIGSNGQVDYQLKEDELVEILKEYFEEFESPGKDAGLVWQNEKFEVSEEESGLVFDYKQAIELLKKNLVMMESNNIEMKLVVDNPEVTKTEAEFLKDEATEALGLAPLTVYFKKPEYYQGRKKFEYTEWYINQEQLRNWLQLKQDDFGQIYLGVNQELVDEFLDGVVEIVDTPAKDAKFEVQDGRVVEWQSSSDGFITNIEATTRRIERNLVIDKLSGLDLVLSVDKSKISNENVNDIGIRELVGQGESDFSGSPRNRRHNIAVGAETLNGLLIKPGEEFSLLEALGDIDAEAGYKQEMVIKGDRTVPEYGGGLCQIGTTIFRAAINTGLDITQRRNHSYRVGYYEPAGFDATIYDPWPDFRFINDTDNHLLLQTRIEGDILIFEFWGTSDGREIEVADPVVYNITAPGEPKYIITGALQPGEKRRTERAHNGADAYFTRTITWPEGSEKEPLEETWESHYIPWREVWMIGATSTGEVISD